MRRYFVLSLIIILLVIMAPVSAGAMTRDWTKFTGVNTSAVKSTAADQDGNVYVGGWVAGTLPNQTAGGGIDGFIRKYSRNGGIHWTRQIGGSGWDEVSGVAVGTQGNIYVVGFLGGTNSTRGQGFLYKYGPHGKLLSVRPIGSGHVPSGVAVAPRGAVYVVGATNAALSGQISSGYIDAFVRKYSPRGGVHWTRQFGTDDWDDLKSVVVDKMGYVYVAGGTARALPNQNSGGAMDAFVRKYSPRGGVHWTRQFGSDGFEWAEDITVDSRRNVYLVGYESGGSFARKYDAGGTRLWTRKWSGQWAFSVSADSERNIYIGGMTSGGASLSSSFIQKYSPVGNRRWDRSFARGVVFGTDVDATDNLYAGGTRATSLWGGDINPAGSDAFLARFLN